MAIINQRYELHEVLRDEEGIRSARGQDLASGQSIEVHIFLNGQSQDSKMLLRRVVSMPRGGSSALFDFGEEQGTPYVVTRPLGGPFREWVLLGVSGGVQAAPVPPVPAPLLPPPPMHAQGLPQDPFAHLFQPAMTPSPSAGGGYTATQMMPAGPIVPLPPPPLPPPPAAMAAPPPPPPPPPPLAPGMPPLPPPKAQAMGAVTVEFHRLFADDQNVATMRSSSPLLPAAPPQPAVPAPPPVQAQAPAGETPGEFTLMFGVPRKNVSPSGANAGPPAFPAPPPVSPALPAAVIAPAPPPPPPPAVPAAPPVLTAGPGALPPSPVSPAPVVAPALPPPPPAVPAAPPVLTAGPGALPPPPPGRLEALPKGPVAFQLSFHPPVLPVATPAASREPGQRKPPIPAPVSAQFPTGSETVGDLSKILGSAGAAKPNEVKVSAEALTAGEPAAPGEFTAMFRAAIPAPPPAPEEPTTLKTPVPADVQAAVAPAEESQQREMGEFTRMFQAPKLATETPSSPPVEAGHGSGGGGEFTNIFQEPAAAATPVAATQPQKGGEFTNMFQTPAMQPPVSANASTTLQAKGGEFTNLFQPSAVTAGPPPASQRPVSSDVQPLTGGEFTNLFLPSVQPTVVTSPPPAQPSAGVGNRPTQPIQGGEFTSLFEPVPRAGGPSAAPLGGGEFTSLFQSPVAARSEPGGPPASVGGAGGEFTRMFGAPGAGVPVPQEPVAPPPPGAEAGEFTRMFQAPQGSAFQGASPPIPPPLSSAPRGDDFARRFEPSTPTPPMPPPLPAGSPVIERKTIALSKDAFSGGPGMFDGPRGAPVPQPAPPPQNPMSATVEFHRLFENEPKTIQAPVPRPPPAQPQPPPPGAEAGEFTRMFQAGGAGAPAAPPPQQPQRQQPGEFTQMMNSGLPPRPPGVRPNSYITAEEGESTQMFKAPLRTPVTGRAPIPAPPPPPMPSAPPGEFTQMFHRQQNPGGMPPPPAASNEFGGLFQNPGGRGSDYQMPNLPQQPFAPKAAQAPNEFDDLFGGPKAQPQAAPYNPGQFGGGVPGAGGMSATSAFSVNPAGGPPPGAGPNYGGQSMAPASGGNSYTQFMKSPGGGQQGPSLGMGQQPQQPQGWAPLPPLPGGKKGVPNFVWVGGGVLLLLIIATIAFFALRRH